MTQDNIQQDTPQQEYASLEEAVFGKEGSQDDISSAFTSGEEGNTETAPIEGQPEVSTQENIPAPVNQDNDTTRYQYWQSQSDKKDQRIQELEARMNQTAQPQLQAQQQLEAPVKESEPFPEPPEKPQQPHGFNREEAYSDPSSASARYSNELENWRDDINEYNSLKSQYQTAVVEEKLNNIETARQDDIKRAQAQQQIKQQTHEITSHVKGHYGMNDSEAVDFVNKMSDPNSITVDNLVQLYRMQQGNAAPQQNPAPAQPSAAFNQAKNAQQVPSPMGVMPSGQSNVDGRTFEDKIMDKMVGDFNSKNPWK